MQLAEDLDPEEWHRIMNRFLEILTDGVHRFEGTVNQYTGDGIMALFGAPIAHEDHAHRACYAALHLRDELRRYADQLRVEAGLNFAVRMGVNSGEVVVGKIGDDLRMDYTAHGATVGLAARMEQLAEPGKVLLTEHTAKLIAGFFQLRDLGVAHVKGVSDPVCIYALEDVGVLRTRFDLSRSRGLSKFVGRANEMGRLEAALEQAASGRGQIIGVVAEPGVGKSRLCHEFTEHCRARGVRVTQTQGLPHGRMIPLRPWMELLRNYFGILDSDTDETARDKVAGRLLRLAPDLAENLPVLFEFLGMPDAHRPAPPLDPEARQRRIFEITRRAMRARSEHGETHVILFEDLHWFDDSSAAFLADMLAAVGETRTLALVNFRPEFQAEWMHSPFYHSIALRPLPETAITELLDDILGTDHSIQALAAVILERTAGTPFFVEELIRDLVETGRLEGTPGAYRLRQPVSTVPTPPSVQAILAGRIDRLSPRDKDVLQVAAVIGKQFSEPLLERVLASRDVAGTDGGGVAHAGVRGALQALQTANFVYVQSIYPEADYVFQHPVTQEIAYNSQLGERRARIHAAVARAIEAGDAAKLDAQAALLAYHWQHGGELARAVEWHRRAADWMGRRDRRGARAHWQQVVALLERCPDTPEMLALAVLARQRLLVSGVFVGMSHAEAEQLFRDGTAIAMRLESPLPQLLLTMGFGLTRMFAGAPAEGVQHMEEGLRVAEATGDRFPRYLIRVALISPLVHTGRLHEALARSEEAEGLSGGDPQLGVELTGFSPLGVMYANRAQALTYLGRLAEVRPALERANEIAQQRRDPELLSMVNVFEVQACDITGDGPRAMPFAQRAVEIAEGNDSPQLRVGGYGALALALLLNRDWHGALEALRVALGAMRCEGTGRFLEVPYLVHEAAALAGCDDLDRARAQLDDALALAEARGGTLSQVYAQLTLAGVLTRLGDSQALQRADDTVDAAARLIETTAARAYEPRLHWYRAGVQRRRGDLDACVASLRTAHRVFVALGATPRAKHVAAELLGLGVRTNEPDTPDGEGRIAP